MEENRGGIVQQKLLQGIDVALQKSGEITLSYVDSIRRRRPNASPQEVARSLEQTFLRTVTGSGAAVGAAAAAPGVGTGAVLVISGGEAVGFMTAASGLIISLAGVHGIEVHEIERRRTLLMAALLGNSGTEFVRRAADRTGAHWGRLAVEAIPMQHIRAINKVLGKNFVTKYGTKQGILVLGKAVPFGIGSAIGGVGNYAFGQVTVRAARSAFGELPDEWTW